MKILLNCSRRPAKSNWLKSCLMGHVQREQAWCSLRRSLKPRRPSVRPSLFPLVLGISTTKCTMQRSSSSICMVGGPSTCGSTTVGIRLRRRLLRAGKRFRYRRTGCEVFDSFYLSIVLAAYLSKIVPFRRSNSPSCVVVTDPSNLVKLSFCTYAPFVAPSLKEGS